jgi:mannose-1-phosphate guanylyltransferase/mannose-6-phosphate isomerase
LPDGQGGPVWLNRFIEKPDAETAQKLVDTGNSLWNSGIFLASVTTILEAFDNHAPKMVSLVKDALLDAKPDLGFTRLDEDHWAQVDPISLDYAVMEKASNLCVVPYNGKWTDLGDWSSVWRETENDGIALSEQAIALDCKDTMLRSEVGGQVIVGIGLEDIVAIAMPDAVLVSHKDRTQDVKIAVENLKATEAKQAEDFPKDHRPWGWFESIAAGDRFQVKRIVVHPGASLSLQSHHHRSEHWIVVEGTAKVTVGDVVKLVSENESVYVPLGATHRLENPGKLPMILIEVQTGAYLGEDDIIRYEDQYARE